MRSLSYDLEIDITVLDGLPITVLVSMLPEEKDNGINGDFVDSWKITHVKNRPVRNPAWLYKRINSANTWRDEVMEAIQNELEYHQEDCGNE